MVGAEKKCITGEHWSYQAPNLYKFKYFIFTPALGGIAHCPPCLDFSIAISGRVGFIAWLKQLHGKYPCTYIALQKSGRKALRIALGGEVLFDYDMSMALEIENELAQRAAEGKLSAAPEDAAWGARLYFRSQVKSLWVNFAEKGIDWVSSSPDKHTGLVQQRLRIDMHTHEDIDSDMFFAEFKGILDLCNIEYMGYKELAKNYMIFLGNGRQGVAGEAYNFSDFVLFKSDFFALAKKYHFIFGHDKNFVSYEVGLDNYNALIKLPARIVKDARKYVLPTLDDL